MKFTASTTSPPLGAVLASKFVTSCEITVEWGEETCLQVSPTLTLNTSAVISRYFATLNPDLQYSTAYENTQIDHWLSFSIGPLGNSKLFPEVIRYIDAALEPVTFLVGTKLTIADLHVFAALFLDPKWEKLSQSPEAPVNVNRWFKFIGNLPNVKATIAFLERDVLKVTKPAIRRSVPKDEGKFVELPGAEMGKVVVRFPPEASGYLHIGHAKAALLNWYYREHFNGALIMRFDDTNPDKEKVAFEQVILEDLKLLQIYPDKFTHTSQYFPLLLELCEKLLKAGTAYVDDTPPEQMKAEREARQPSRNRDNVVDKNFAMWAEMQQGSEFGQRCCVRAKIDMSSDNGCMRDPTIYRCKNEPHPRTGSQYKVYPTYDFACPVVDSIEGVTHALRSMEYHDRDDQFYWFIQALELRKPFIWEYARLNMMNTVLSKRKLAWFVEQGLVENWDDPRFPTVRGVLRRGMTVQGLKQFIIAQGSSRSVVQMEWDKIWAFNKKVIDPVAPRYTALEAGSLVTVNVEGAKAGSSIVAKHPKNNDVGTKTILFGPKVLIAAEDAALLKVGENATFINWGNLQILKLQRDGDGRVTEVFAKLNLGNTDFKKTLKLTWLAKDEAQLTPISVVYYDHIITKPVLAKDEDFKQYINKESKKVVSYIGDPDLVQLQTGDIIQLQRIGFFRVDSASAPGKTLILIHIPDGSSKSPISSAANQQTVASSQSSVELSDKDIEGIAGKWKEDRNKTLGSAKTSSALSGNLTDQIAEQGNKVRLLKADKASKPEIEAAVKQLLALKVEYKAATGQEWKPAANPVPVPAVPATATATSTGNDISQKIVEQGNLVRQLKADKASKPDVEAAVKGLLALKVDYKIATGQEWKPGTSPAPVIVPVVQATAAVPAGGNEISQKIVEQGNLVRQLKAEKSSKPDVEAAVKTLLALKVDYKAATGQEWKPGTSPAPVIVPVVPATATVPSNGNEISQKIVEQGNLVRQLKADKAAKPEIEAAVKSLLALKVDYKVATGQEWKPAANPVPVPAVPATATVPAAGNEMSQKIIEQGNLVRQLKADKAAKPEIETAVKQLLALKVEYKSATGQDWKPGTSPVPAVQATAAVPAAGNEMSQKIVEIQTLLASKVDYKKTATEQAQKPDSDLSAQITEQGDKVRQLKAEKASKAEIEAAVKLLLTLKQNFKNSTGSDWQPNLATASPKVDLDSRIAAQGDKIRDLKASKADKATIEAEVKVLLGLKTEFKNSTGEDWKPKGDPPQRQAKEKKVESGKKGDKKGKEKGDKEKSVEKDDEKGMKKQTRLGLEARKDENLPDWYSQVITKGEMIEYYDVSGCYILRPWAFSVWEAIQTFLDKEIKKLGVVNAYFPMFVSKSVLEREKAHIADFAPEVAWVTKSGDSDLAEHIAIRPTSETAMYPAYSKWIQSHRDLPLRLNQWNNVVRWEFKHPQPFLRTREFLWQEGHTAFASYKEAEEEVYQILELYAQVYTDLLAIPVVKGRKTEKEKFAGGDFTTTVEAFISASGRGIQGATSHHLGQNFSKMFDITVEDPETKEKMFVFQNSWGLTTRTIGVMIMVHADNQGLVMPPAVSAIQVVIVPCGITASLAERTKVDLINTSKQLDKELLTVGVRSKLDERDNYSPGWKFNHWELKGVPLRVELGPKDLEKKQLVAVRRDTGEKVTLTLANAAGQIEKLLKTIQAALFSRAEEELKAHTHIVTDWNQFCPILDAKNIILAPFCESVECEENIKKDSARDQDLEPGAPAMGAKSLCIPFQQPAIIQSTDICIHPSCSKPAKSYTLFGRSY